MATEISQLEQYKMLRDEVMQCMREAYNTQVGAAIAAASVYTWLLSHKPDVHLRAVWFVAPCVIFVGAIRAFELTLRIRSIGGYLKRIESRASESGSELSGWEHYKSAHRWIDIRANLSAFAVWLLEFAAAMVVSWLLSE